MNTSGLLSLRTVSDVPLHPDYVKTLAKFHPDPFQPAAFPESMFFVKVQALRIPG